MNWILTHNPEMYGPHRYRNASDLPVMYQYNMCFSMYLIMYVGTSTRVYVLLIGSWERCNGQVFVFKISCVHVNTCAYISICPFKWLFPQLCWSMRGAMMKWARAYLCIYFYRGIRWPFHQSYQMKIVDLIIKWSVAICDINKLLIKAMPLYEE